MNDEIQYNDADYPQSPDYYVLRGVDCSDLMPPKYWLGSAVAHLFRAGRKPGETVQEAIVNAFVCLALWFRSVRMQVPYYSTELHRMRVEIEELNERLEDARNCANASDREVARLRVELEAALVAATTMGALKEWANGTDSTPTTFGDEVQVEYTGDTTVGEIPCPVTEALRPVAATLDTPVAPAIATLPTAAEIDRALAAGDGERMHSLTILTGNDVTVVCDDDALEREGVKVTRELGATTFTREAAPAPVVEEWTNEELRKWLDHNHSARLDEPWRRWFTGESYPDNKWVASMRLETHVPDNSRWSVPDDSSRSRQRLCNATEAARILGAVKPPVAEWEDDELIAWLNADREGLVGEGMTTYSHVWPGEPRVSFGHPGCPLWVVGDSGLLNATQAASILGATKVEVAR